MNYTFLLKKLMLIFKGCVCFNMSYVCNFNCAHQKDVQRNKIRQKVVWLSLFTIFTDYQKIQIYFSQFSIFVRRIIWFSSDNMIPYVDVCLCNVQYSFIFRDMVCIAQYCFLFSNSLSSIENNLIYFLHDRFWARNKGHTICS